METVLSKAGLKVGDRVEVVSGKHFDHFGRIIGYCGSHFAYIDFDGPQGMLPDNVEISNLRRLDPSDPQPEDEGDYNDYYIDVSDDNAVDVYAIHNKFQVSDHSGCLQHASKKILLAGVRTGGKSKYKDIKEARDTLNRWLEINNENDQD